MTFATKKVLMLNFGTIFVRDQRKKHLIYVKATTLTIATRLGISCKRVSTYDIENVGNILTVDHIDTPIDYDMLYNRMRHCYSGEGFHCRQRNKYFQDIMLIHNKHTLCSLPICWRISKRISKFVPSYPAFIFRLTFKMSFTFFHILSHDSWL